MARGRWSDRSGALVPRYGEGAMSTRRWMTPYWSDDTDELDNHLRGGELSLANTRTPAQDLVAAQIRPSRSLIGRSRSRV